MTLNLTRGTIRVAIANIKRQNSGLTSNAAAQVYAQKHHMSFMPKLDTEDKTSLTTMKAQSTYVPVIAKKSSGKPSSPKWVEFFTYPTVDIFQKKHVEEINIAYNAKCYTAAFLLCRKVIQNLIVDLLIKQFPPNKAKKNKELYFDFKRRRFLDFSVILKNLYDNRNLFPVTAVHPIQVLNGKASKFTKDANNQTHYWYYIAKKKDLDDADIDQILSLIKTVDESI